MGSEMCIRDRGTSASRSAVGLLLIYRLNQRRPHNATSSGNRPGSVGIGSAVRRQARRPPESYSLLASYDEVVSYEAVSYDEVVSYEAVSYDEVAS